MARLLKFWSLPRREKQLFCEAGILLLFSNLCVRTIAFKHIDNFLRARWKCDTEGAFERGDDIRLVNLSLSRTVNLLPWKNLCLSQSIAAFIMLRRRGIPAVIVAGVKFAKESSLLAHAWIQIDYGVSDENSANKTFIPVVAIGHAPLIAGSERNSVD